MLLHTAVAAGALAVVMVMASLKRLKRAIVMAQTGTLVVVNTSQALVADKKRPPGDKELDFCGGNAPLPPGTPPDLSQ